MPFLGDETFDAQVIMKQYGVVKKEELMSNDVNVEAFMAKTTDRPLEEVHRTAYPVYTEVPNNIKREKLPPAIAGAGQNNSEDNDPECHEPVSGIVAGPGAAPAVIPSKRPHR